MKFEQMITAATRHSGLSCPRCASLSYRRHGKHLGIQRFRCKTCGRTFKETVNTPLHWIHYKQLMPGYIQTMNLQYSLRAAAREFNISQATSFRWRHKLLASLTAKSQTLSSIPAGICQIKLPFSFKGKRTLPETPLPDTYTILITDAQGATCLSYLHDKNRIRETAHLLSATFLHSSIIACPSVSYISRAVYASGHKTVLFKAEKKRLLMQANIVSQKLKCWMERFRGVATKYLQQYWNWFCAEQSAPTTDQFATECFGQRQIMHYRMIIAK